MMEKVTIYTVPFSKPCENAKEYLRRKGVAYKEIDIQADERAALEVFDVAGEAEPPIIVAGGTVIAGFDPLGLDGIFSTPAA